eukprot:1425941-Rhodomonas_salina.1
MACALRQTSLFFLACHLALLVQTNAFLLLPSSSLLSPHLASLAHPRSALLLHPRHARMHAKPEPHLRPGALPLLFRYALTWRWPAVIYAMALLCHYAVRGSDIGYGATRSTRARSSS